MPRGNWNSAAHTRPVTNFDYPTLWREIITRLEEGDLDGYFAHFDVSYVHHARSDEPDARDYHGLEDYKSLVAMWTEMFESFRVEAHDVLDDGNGRVAAVTTLHGVGRGSGATVKQPYVFVTQFRDGRAIETWEFASVEEAQAAGQLRH